MRPIIDATLTPTQRNATFTYVVGQLDPAEFDWSEVTFVEFDGGYRKSYAASRLTHRSTGYYFIFGNHRVECSPGRQTKVEVVTDLVGWTIKIPRFRIWLECLKVEVEAPDLWAALGTERDLSDAAASSLENSPFTPTEREKIQQSLDEMKAYLLTGNQVQAERAEFVETQFHYLASASGRVGRKDWLLILYATLVNTAVAVALPTEDIHGLLRLGGALLQGLWTHAQNWIR